MKIAITMTQGASLTHKFTFQASGRRTHSPVGWTAALHVATADGYRPVIECTLENERLELTDAALGVLTLRLKPDDTRNLKFGKDEDVLDCVWDLALTDPDGERHVPVRGTFTIQRAVTR